MARPVLKKVVLLIRRPATWIIAATLVVALLYIALATRDSRIPAKAGFPDDSADPVLKEPGRPATAYCPRSDYVLKWVVWDGEFVPRCVPKGSD